MSSPDSMPHNPTALGEYELNHSIELYPESLHAQVDQFIGAKKKSNEQKPEHAQIDSRNYEFLRGFFEDLFTERTNRTHDIESEEYQVTKKLANDLFPTKPFWNLCMDGRVLAVLTNGSTFGIGSSIRVPGAMHREFIRGTDGKLFLRPDTTYTEKLSAAIENEPSGVISEIYDSHLGCAAREKEENQAGKKPTDKGLMADVLSKKEISDATIKFVKDKYGDSKRVITIQTSFDPHNGFMYMGLETENALRYARGFADAIADKNGIDRNKVKPEYTDEAIKNLVDSHGIISTKELSETEGVRRVFEEHNNYQLDWKNNYVESAKNFWNSISDISPKLMPGIQSLVKEFYPEADDLEVKQRAFLILTNCYSGYMLNQHKYEFDEHKENGIKIYDGGQPPYNVSMFVLNPYLKDLPENIELAAQIVRSNRANGRIGDPTESFTDPEEFANAVVPIVVQEIIRTNITDDEWSQLSSIEWNDDNSPMPENWDTMSDNEFNEYLQKKGDFRHSIVDGINNLRHNMATLYNPDLPIASRLIEQYKIVLPVLSGQNRRIKCLIPFTKEGFAN